MINIAFRLYLTLISVSAPQFENGVHLINEDAVEHTVIYTESILPSTRICRCVTPTESMKNGLNPVHFRTNVKGFTVIRIHKKDNLTQEVTARIAPHAKIFCLSLSIESFHISGTGNLKLIRNGTIFISNGKIYFQK